MKKYFVFLAVFIALGFMSPAALWADDNAAPQAQPSQASDFSGSKLDQVAQKQDEILKKLDEIKAELEIVKIRASNR